MIPWLSPGRISRTPGTEVIIDQTITVTDSDNRPWRIEHGIENASTERLAVILRHYGPITEPIGPTSQLAGALLATRGDLDEAVRLVEQAAAWRAWAGEQPTLVPIGAGRHVPVQPDICEPDPDPDPANPPPPRWVDALAVSLTPVIQFPD